jgi:hypothetical protein
MVIAKSPVLVNGPDRRQVVLNYNEKPGEFRIAVSSLYVQDGKTYEEDNSGLYTKDERRAQYLFLENWETLHSCGYMIDQDDLAANK